MLVYLDEGNPAAFTQEYQLEIEGKQVQVKKDEYSATWSGFKGAWKEILDTAYIEIGHSIYGNFFQGVLCKEKDWDYKSIESGIGSEFIFYFFIE